MSFRQGAGLPLMNMKKLNTMNTIYCNGFLAPNTHKLARDKLLSTDHWSPSILKGSSSILKESSLYH